MGYYRQSSTPCTSACLCARYASLLMLTMVQTVLENFGKKVTLCSVFLTAGCLEPNPDYHSPPDMKPCPMYKPGGGGGKDRPEIFLVGGQGPVGGKGSYKILPFFLDVFEISVSAYRDCVTDPNPLVNCSRPGTGGGCTWSDSVGTPESEAHPINCINWQQAHEFCVWANRRLPTEAEWEFAAGGPAGSASTYPWGASAPAVDIQQQLCWNADGTCAAATYPASLGGHLACGGAFDLAGNVHEWTSSEYASTYSHPSQDCNFEKSPSCTARGGSWSYTAPVNVQVANRSDGRPSLITSNIGARCARNP